jgi:predicted DNA-binding ribbon-helix-helix protein
MPDIRAEVVLKPSLERSFLSIAETRKVGSSNLIGGIDERSHQEQEEDT